MRQAQPIDWQGHVSGRGSITISMNPYEWLRVGWGKSAVLGGHIVQLQGRSYCAACSDARQMRRQRGGASGLNVWLSSLIIARVRTHTYA